VQSHVATVTMICKTNTTKNPLHFTTPQHSRRTMFIYVDKYGTLNKQQQA